MARNTSTPIPELSEAELALSYGAGYISVAISGMLYGVACLQTLEYFRSAKAATDPWVIKVLVIWMFVLDSVQQAADIHIFYFYLVPKHNTLDKLVPLDWQPNVWSVPTMSLLTAILATTTDSFLTYRVWKRRNPFMAALCSTLTLASAIASIVFHAQEYMSFSDYMIPQLTATARFSDSLRRSLIEAQLSIKDMAIASIALTAAADVTVAGTMAYYLLRNQPGLRRSNAVIMRLMTLSITTGVISALVALATLASYFDKLAVIALFPISGKIYSNAFLTLLNVREYMAGIWDNSDWVADWNSIHPSRIPDVESFHPTTGSAVQAAPVSVCLEDRAESIIDSDIDSDALGPNVCS